MAEEDTNFLSKTRKRIGNIISGDSTAKGSTFHSRTVKGGERTKAEVSQAGIRRVEPKKLEYLYAKDSSIFQAVNLISNQTIAPGLVFEGGTNKAVDTIKDWIQRNRFKKILLRATRHVLIFGSAYMELVYDTKGKYIVDVSAIDPKTIDVIRDLSTDLPEFDKQGNLKGWEQETMYGKKIEFSKEEDGELHPRIVQMSLYQLNEGDRGLGIVEPLAKASNVKLQLEDAAGESAFRLGMPLLHAQMGDERNYPTDDDINAQTEQLKNVHNQDVIVTPYTVDLDILQPKELTALSDVLEYFKLIVSGGLGVPSLLLYGQAEDVNKATAQVLVEQFYRTILTYQEEIAYYIQKIIERVLSEKGFKKKEMPNLRFRDPKVESLDVFVENLSELVKSNVVTPDEELEKYVRERQGLPQKGGEELTEKYTCQICGEGFTSKKGLKIHDSKIHSKADRLDDNDE